MGAVDGPGSASGGETTETAVRKLNRAKGGVGDIRRRTARDQRNADADAHPCVSIRLLEVRQRRYGQPPASGNVLRAHCAGQERNKGQRYKDQLLLPARNANLLSAAAP
jgi:hypothetical protein